MEFALIDEFLNIHGIQDVIAAPPIDYKPLEGSDIRLVELQPGEWTDNVEVTISTISLNQNPAYEALSYVWGKPSTTRRILVNGKEHRVTESLELALRHLRAHKRITLWIDALCINQRNVEERGQQVRRMKTIYEQASRVLAWLGPENDDSNLAVQKLHDLSDRHAVHIQVLRNYVSWSDAELIGALDDPQTIKIWKALAKLYSRPWFSRAWVVQEASGPKPLLAFCGLGVIHGSALAIAFMIVQELLMRPQAKQHAAYDMIAEVRAAMENWRQILPFRLQRVEKVQQATEVLPLLHRFRRFDATDPRDKIYTTLSFQEDVPSLVADYNLSIGHVYAGLVRSYIEDKQDLDILGHCRTTDYFSGQFSCWVPDWRSNNRREPFTKNAHGHRFYKASGSSKPRATFSQDLRLLTLDGFQFDTILRISASTEDAQTNEDILAIHWSILDGVYDVDSTYPTGEPIKQAYMRTIVADFSGGFDYSSRDSAEALQEVLGAPVASLELDHVKREPHRGFAMEWKMGPSEETLDSEGYKDYTEAYDFMSSLLTATGGRRFFLSANGYIGLAPEEASLGDVICVLYGGAVPYALWPEKLGHSTDYQFIGECYVHGMMDGEAMEKLDNGMAKVKQFSLF